MLNLGISNAALVDVPRGENSTAGIVYTSGTVAVPKGAELIHGAQPGVRGTAVEQ